MGIAVNQKSQVTPQYYPELPIGTLLPLTLLGVVQ